MDGGTTEPLTLPTLEEISPPSTEHVPDHPTPLFILDEESNEPLALPTLKKLLIHSTEHFTHHLAPPPFGTLNSTQHLPCWFTPKIGRK